jgi:hypothetical protein
MEPIELTDIEVEAVAGGQVQNPPPLRPGTFTIGSEATNTAIVTQINVVRVGNIVTAPDVIG